MINPPNVGPAFGATRPRRVLLPFHLRHLAVLGAILCATQAPAATDLLVAPGATWSFWDKAVAPAAGWTTAAFAEVTWGSGAAPLGYGNGDETTRLSYGTNASAKQITAYFRHRFWVDDPSRYASLDLGVVRDDGVVVYLNGVEIFRSNLPTGTIGANTLASSSVGGADETTPFRATATADGLVSGWNQLAAEVHQANATSGDLRFDLQLSALHRPILIAAASLSPAPADTPSTATLVARASHPEGQALTVRFSGRRSLPPGADFTLIALPDTQYYVSSKNGGQPEMFTTQTDWIISQRDARNIAFITELGDCVENGDNGGNDIEWRHATNALYRLENPFATERLFGLPYGVAVGNHDISGVNSTNPTTRFYNQYFGVSHFAGKDYYGGHFGRNNNNHYELFSASGLDFIIVHLEYDETPETAVLDWADQVLKAHPARRAIIVSHYLMEKGTGASFGPQGRAVYDALKDNPNLFLMLCGHVPGEGRRSDTHQGRTVHTVLSDYQGRVNGGDGWLRILQFSPSNNVIRISTYSPTLGQYETDADSQFELPYDMSRPLTPFEPIATLSNVSSGTEVSVPWPNLEPDAFYEWCAEASDGTEVAVSTLQCVITRAAHPAIAQPNPAQAAPTLQMALDRIGNQVLLAWPTEPGQRFRVVVKEHLGQAQWTDLSSDLDATGKVLIWADPITAASAQRYYAVRLLP